MGYKVIDNLEEASLLYEAGVLWYARNRPTPTEFMFPVPAWWSPANPYCTADTHTYAIKIEE